MAEWEREEISGRIAASIPVRAKLGKPLGGQAPFGYSWKNKQFVINESESPIRKLMYEIFLRTLRKKTTADELNRLGHRTRKGVLFSDTTVTRLLKDTTAKGERIANYTKTSEDGRRATLKPKSEWTITKCPQIVSKKTWEKVNRIIAIQESRSARLGRKSEYLLSGFVKCSCSKKMYIRTSLKAYQCKSCNIKIAVVDIERIFYDYLSECINSHDLARQVENTKGILQKKQLVLEETMNEKLNLEATMDTFIAMRMDGGITREHFMENLHSLNTKLAQLDEFVKKLQSELDSQTLRIKELEEYVFEAQALVKDWANVEFQRKRVIVESIIKQILITEWNIDIELSIDLQNVLPARKKSFGDLPNTPSLIFDKKFCKPLPGKYPQNPTTIGEHIRKKRIDSDLSQSQLAQVIGVSSDCITNWENNRSAPQISYYPRIRQFLGFDTIDFDETTFSGRLQSNRSRNGMCCEKMAKLLDVDKSTIRAWEKGTNKPAGKMIKKFEELFRKSDVKST